ncbi:MAG: extracellular solute-binding protein [Chloroflexia bacterium]|nr:extracellular solute-binding protein [Chloroflexia bacterium]
MAHPQPTRLDDLLTKRPLSRRALTGGAAAGLALPAFLRSSGGAAAATELDFVIWSYGVEIVQDNITLFQERSPETTVTLSDFAWNVYRETMVNRFQAQTPTDVAYNGGDWLEEFATAGWVVPLEDHFDWVAGYQDKVLGFAWQDMTFDGKVYGLPYYADTITFMYDEQALADAGIEAPPTTWEEVLEQSLLLKEGGMEYPFIYELDQTLPTITEVYTSMVFGRGGELIDEAKVPLWDQPEQPANLQFKWLVDARNEHQILTFVPHETDVVRAMNTGQHAFTVMYNYNLAALNNAATSPMAGRFKLALMPGETHECYGFAKFYNMTTMAADRGPEAIAAAGDFIQYFGGEIDGEAPIAKRWAVENGLGFGLTSLLDDPEVEEAYSQWVDLALWREQLDLARARRQSVWYGIWGEFFRRQYAQAMAGEISADEALAASAEEWNELKERIEG